MVGLKQGTMAVVSALLFATVLAQEADSQYWHERYHGILSMAAYGDYDTLCPQQTFTEAEKQLKAPDSPSAAWQVINTWQTYPTGLQGFSAVIPEMDKVVMVFRGMYGWEQLNMTAAPIGEVLNLGPECSNCTAHAGALAAYLEAKEATNDWAVEKQYVETTGHQWSITGHGFGGMVSLIASLDLGWRGLCHWSHNHGAPRTFNPSAANLYNSLFAGEAGQRTVANNDIVPTIIPESNDYTFTLQGYHIFGQNNTDGHMSFTVCNTPTDPECLGGNSNDDHLFYYTPIGQCGNPVLKNTTIEYSVRRELSSSFYETATSTWTPSTTYSPPAKTSDVSESSTTSTNSAQSGSQADGANAGTSSESSNEPTSDVNQLKQSILSITFILGGFIVFDLFSI
ncbi:hypothetical protein OIO90_006393 [Microbotryomycetes sp. JL221]|nr:hypothetical protein OIO90_006393 [Microbotryomycetes sp. JL221]